MQKLFMLQQYIERLANEFGAEWLMESDGTMMITIEGVTIRIADEGYEVSTQEDEWLTLESVSHLKGLVV